ncbi:MAG: hypothetical protein IKA84_06095 [Clostridia bacterium]|nr:hypothetical protein [Clostridia bacterium]
MFKNKLSKTYAEFEHTKRLKVLRVGFPEAIFMSFGGSRDAFSLFGFALANVCREAGKKRGDPFFYSTNIPTNQNLKSSHLNLMITLYTMQAQKKIAESAK